MPIKKRKKVEKMRGSNSHGYGYKKKHRGKGSKGGKGRAGSFKHKKSLYLNQGWGHLGKAKGFKSLKQREVIVGYKAINLRDIEKIRDKTKNEVDLSSLGYDKVLSSGSVSKPLEIKARYFSKGAEEKIQKAGGKALKV